MVRLGTAIFVAAGLLSAPTAQADGFFLGVKLNRANVDVSRTTEPGVIDSTRTRPALFAGYQFDTGLEFQLEHWSGSTGQAVCRIGVTCPAIAIPTKARFTNATVGYEVFPTGGPFSMAGRIGIEQGRALFGTESRSRTSAIAGVTARYRVTDSIALGFDVAGSTFKTTRAGLELRISL